MKGWKKYNGKLDTRNESDGEKAIYYCDENVEIVLDPQSVDNVKDALDQGLDVSLSGDVDGVATDSNGYGVTGVYVNGSTFDGNNHTINVSKANGTWDSAVATNGGTIKNLKVEGAFRGIFTGGLKSDLYLENIYLSKWIYIMI